jgi:hypothetical protein
MFYEKLLYEKKVFWLSHKSDSITSSDSILRTIICSEIRCDYKIMQKYKSNHYWFCSV